MNKYTLYIVLSLCCSYIVKAQDADKNYIKITNYVFGEQSDQIVNLNSALTEDTQAKSLNEINLNDGFDTDGHEFEAIAIDRERTNVDIQYVDGFGAPLQDIQVKASPTGKDIVQPYVYDEDGRQLVNFMPYTAATQNNGYHDNAITNVTYSGSSVSSVTGELMNFYSNANADYATSNYPYSEVRYDNSPLNRPLEQSSAGAEWKMGSGHTITNNIEYYNNGEIDVWTYNSSSSKWEKTPATTTITATAVTNEDDQTVTEYKDIFGNVIRKDAEELVTDYIYNSYGDLIYVLPPAISGLESFTAADDTIKKCAYMYKYDYKGRMNEKKIPGADPVYIGYDYFDRPAFTQDGNQLEKNKWTYTWYDEKGRPAVVSEMEDTENKNERGLMSGLSYVTQRTSTASTDYYTQHHFGQADFYPTYTNLVINYYDDHDMNMDGTADYPDLYDDEGYSLLFPIMQSSKGMLTMQKTRVLGSDDFVTTYNMYNTKGQVAKSMYFGTYSADDGTNNSLRICIDGSYDLFVHDFTGNVEKSVSYKKNQFIKNGIVISTKEVTEVHDFEYDQRGRLLKETMRINNEPAVVLAENEYNELGQLKNTGLNVENGISLQDVNYKYNIKGWMTEMNASENDGTEGLFGLNLHYTDPRVLVPQGPSISASYSGNIISAFWHHQVDGKQEHYAYQYTYDKHNRLTTAFHYVPNPYYGYGLNSDASVSVSEYDKNGNIRSLKRGNIDNLSYTYTGNQLKSVNDASDFSDPTMAGMHFEDGPELNDEYHYDDNGNMTIDRNKGIENIAYNNLNLPEEITLAGNRVIRNTYLASGTKLMSTAIDNGAIQEFSYYNGNLVFKGDNFESTELDVLLHSYGRAVPDEATGTFDTQYFLKDHLGNTRVTFAKGDDGKAKIIQQADYYPFGLQMANPSLASNDGQNYLYNGKELERSFNLGWYDYGARFYDASLGRFSTVDPLAEMMPGASPYSYCFNNPMIFTDPTGMAPQGGDAWNYMNEQLDEEDAGQDALYRAQGELVNSNSDIGNEENSNTIEESDNQNDNQSDNPYSNNSNTETYNIFNLISDIFNDLFMTETYLPSGEPIPVVKYEIEPYVSVSIGKQTYENSIIPISWYGTYMWTPRANYLTIGTDFSANVPTFKCPSSLSLSVGWIVGPRSGIEGWGAGYSYGSIFGVDRGYSLNYQNKYPYFNRGQTNMYGLNVGHQYLYGSYNYGYTFKLNDNN